ncbi:hypothetical protein WN944_001758 [Citrus x changshan-huyou]|uniref:Cyclin C-terminal domain-containing protein n=1 Tax=Citrus x changshan-huyou TaxID=2935761 RepID=A0AAP0MF93_9ROSI
MDDFHLSFLFGLDDLHPMLLAESGRIVSDDMYVPSAIYTADENAGLMRHRSMKLMDLVRNLSTIARRSRLSHADDDLSSPLLEDVPHPQYLEHVAMNFFDRYMCFNKDLMNNGDFEIVDSVMIGCIVTAARIMDLKLSTAQLVANKHGLKEKQESLDNWARVTAAEFDHIIPTDKFLDAFLEDVVTEFKLNIDIAKILKALAYRYAIISSKNVIALVGFRPSMLAASAVLVAVKILVEEH